MMKTLIKYVTWVGCTAYKNYKNTDRLLKLVILNEVVNFDAISYRCGTNGSSFWSFGVCQHTSDVIKLSDFLYIMKLNET